MRTWPILSFPDTAQHTKELVCFILSMKAVQSNQTCMCKLAYI